MTMIEKMPRAMGMIVYERDGLEKAKHIVDRCWQDWVPEARAALTAMLEPSEAMVKAGKPWAGVSGDSSRKTIMAAIQAALDEPTIPPS